MSEQKKWRWVILPLLIHCFAGCGVRGCARESWTLMQILTTGERIETHVEKVAVRNCGISERKTVECSAGTASSFIVQLGGSGGVSAGGEVTLDPALATELGVEQESGESLDLPPAPDGYIAHYTVEKTYRLLSGEVLAHSSRGAEKKMQYAFKASCSQRILDVNLVPCEDTTAVPLSEAPPTNTPTQPSPTDTLTATPRPMIKPSHTPTFVPPTLLPTPTHTYTPAPEPPSQLPDSPPEDEGAATPISP